MSEITVQIPPTQTYRFDADKNHQLSKLELLKLNEAIRNKTEDQLKDQYGQETGSKLIEAKRALNEYFSSATGTDAQTAAKRTLEALFNEPGGDAVFAKLDDMVEPAGGATARPLTDPADPATGGTAVADPAAGTTGGATARPLDAPATETPKESTFAAAVELDHAKKEATAVKDSLKERLKALETEIAAKKADSKDITALEEEKALLEKYQTSLEAIEKATNPGEVKAARDGFDAHVESLELEEGSDAQGQAKALQDLLGKIGDPAENFASSDLPTTNVVIGHLQKALGVDANAANQLRDQLRDIERTPASESAAAPAPSDPLLEPPARELIEGLTDETLKAARAVQTSSSRQSGTLQDVSSHEVNGHKILLGRDGQAGIDLTKEGPRPFRRNADGTFSYTGPAMTGDCTIWTDNDHFVDGEFPESWVSVSHDPAGDAVYTFGQSLDNPDTAFDERTAVVNPQKFGFDAEGKMVELKLTETEQKAVSAGRGSYHDQLKDKPQFVFEDSGALWDVTNKQRVEGSRLHPETLASGILFFPGESAHDYSGIQNVHQAIAQGIQQKMLDDLKKSRKQRLLEMLINALGGGGGFGGGIGPELGGGFGPSFGPGGYGGGDGWNFGVNVGYGNEDFGAQVGVGMDSNGNWGVNGGFQNENFGANVSFGSGFPGSACGVPGYASICGTVVDFETLLLMIVAILEEQERENIAGILRKMNQLSKQQKGVSSKDANAGGMLAGLNTDSAILQTQLTMAVQKRQRLLEMLDNAIRSAHEAKHNSVRRMV